MTLLMEYTVHLRQVADNSHITHRRSIVKFSSTLMKIFISLSLQVFSFYSLLQSIPHLLRHVSRRQEGVEDGIYVPIEVNVHTQAGEVLTCRSYQMRDCVFGPPSPQYKKVICMGAKQNGLPAEYQKKLETIETNNYAGPVPILEEIEAATEAKNIPSA
uniref:gamma-glutamylcyclotransferase n=1 Tax=Apteryx owenii TaxID=8824 RepID=A0A8B9PD32_APTOW